MRGKDEKVRSILLVAVWIEGDQVFGQENYVKGEHPGYKGVNDLCGSVCAVVNMVLYCQVAWKTQISWGISDCKVLKEYLPLGSINVFEKVFFN